MDKNWTKSVVGNQMIAEEAGMMDDSTMQGGIGVNGDYRFLRQFVDSESLSLIKNSSISKASISNET